MEEYDDAYCQHPLSLEAVKFVAPPPTHMLMVLKSLNIGTHFVTIESLTRTYMAGGEISKSPKATLSPTEVNGVMKPEKKKNPKLSRGKGKGLAKRFNKTRGHR